MLKSNVTVLRRIVVRNVNYTYFIKHTKHKSNSLMKVIDNQYDYQISIFHFNYIYYTI